MEFALPSLLNRDDILKILKQRHLDVNTMNEFTQDELLRIYKTFVMPLSRRTERRRKIGQNNLEKNNKNENVEQCMCVEPSESSCNSMDIDFPCGETNNSARITLNHRMSSPVGEKRRQLSDDDIVDACKNDYQYQLSSFTKRIRINSVS